MIRNNSTTTDIKPIRMRCANCGFLFDGFFMVCPKCGSNAIDKPTDYPELICCDII
jgi:predicted Zn-ribbon and HTH transcriptional regulator